MIIIAENKKNHYLIKKFLIESGIDNNHNDVQLNLRPVSSTEHESDPRYYVQQDLKPIRDTNLYADTDVVLPSDRKFKELVKKVPKYKKLKKLAAKGMLTLAMIGILWNSIPRHLDNSYDNTERQTYSAEQRSAEDDVERELINQSPEEKENIIATFDSIQDDKKEDLVFSIEYDTSVDKEEIKRSIIAHEGFDGLPYLDHHQWSVGHGTKAFDSADLADGQHKKLKSDYAKARKKGTSRAKWIEKTIPGWRKKFFETYSIQSDNLSKFSPVTKAQAGVAADNAIDHAITEMKKVEYFKVLPKNIKQAFFDMSYNMGSGFLKKFKNFNEAVKHAAIVLNSPELNEEEVKVVINLLDIAAEEILYNFNPDGSLKGKTKYYSDLESSGRPIENYKKVKSGIEDIKIVISPRNFENQKSNESLIKVYKHLFV